MTDLTGKTAVITGSTSGIVLGLAHGFAQAGANAVHSVAWKADAKRSAPWNVRDRLNDRDDLPDPNRGGPV